MTEQICRFCKESAPEYTCPKCEEQYCSLKCYNSESHSECVEKFKKADKEQDQRDLIEILDKFDMKGESASDWKYELPEEAKQAKDEVVEQLAEEGDLDELTAEEQAELEKVVDSSTAEELWNMLSEQEKDEFKQLLAQHEL